MKLTEAKIKKDYEITAIDFDQASVKRMLSMGIYRGAPVSIERKNEAKAVMLIYACGNFIMLRYQDAERIEVKLI